MTLGPGVAGDGKRLSLEKMVVRLKLIENLLYAFRRGSETFACPFSGG
jgi:hypothetical protein